MADAVSIRRYFRRVVCRVADGCHRACDYDATLYLIHQQLWLVPGLFAALMYLPLYRALKPVDCSLAALGCAVGGVAWALTLAMPTTSTGAPALVYLSDQYAATSDPARRIALVGAAESLIAINRTPTAVGVLTTVGMLIISLVMLRGVFPRWIAYLGIATGILGVASEALRPVIESGYGVYGLLCWSGRLRWDGDCSVWLRQEAR